MLVIKLGASVSTFSMKCCKPEGLGEVLESPWSSIHIEGLVSTKNGSSGEQGSNRMDELMSRGRRIHQCITKESRQTAKAFPTDIPGSGPAPESTTQF